MAKTKQSPKNAATGKKPKNLVKTGDIPKKRTARNAQDATAEAPTGEGVKESGVKPKAGTSKAEAAERRMKFIEALIANGGNATQAAVQAGFSAKTADQQGSRLLKDVKVQAELEARRQKLRERFQLTTENVLQEVARISFFDPRSLLDSKGNLRNINDLDEDTARAIASVEVTEEFSGRGESRQSIGFTKKVRVFDKNAALDKAMKHLGLLKSTVELTGPNGGPVQMQQVPPPDYAKIRALTAKHAARNAGNGR